MPVTLLDGVLIGFTLISAILAMVRGFSREVLSIASWAAAAAAAYYLHPGVTSFVIPYIDHPRLAQAAAVAIIFFAALILVTLVTMKVADFIVDSHIGALDRTLGFLYGAARGILVVAVALLFFKWLVADDQPPWIAEAKSHPLLESVGEGLKSLLPDDPESAIFDRLKPQEGGD